MSAKKSDADHRNYRVRGKVTRNKIKRTQAKGGPKCKPGVRYSDPWVCPEPNLHKI